MSPEDRAILAQAERILRAHEVHDLVVAFSGQVSARCCYRENTTVAGTLAEAVEQAAKIARADGYESDKAYG